MRERESWGGREGEREANILIAGRRTYRHTHTKNTPIAGVQIPNAKYFVLHSVETTLLIAILLLILSYKTHIT